MKLLILAAGLVASAPTAPDTFAIACRGDTLRTAVENGQVVSQKFDLPDQIFVFSESSLVVLRAMPLRHEFENVCDVGATGAQIDFAPGTIRVAWQSGPGWEATTSCTFQFDRSAGEATMMTQFEWSETRRSETEWRMQCSPTPVPIFHQDSQ